MRTIPAGTSGGAPNAGLGEVVSDLQGTMMAEVENEAEGWLLYANCLGVDPDLFFPERGASTKDAKGVCAGCVVREDCLEYALTHGEKFGIWGGLSERERRRIRRQRSLARAAQQSLTQTA